MVTTVATPSPAGAPADGAPVIEVEGLRRRYGEHAAVDGVSFEVHRGEVFGLLGHNGAGKTTTVECVQGLRRRDGGEVRVLGLDPARHPDAVRRRIGSQLQAAALPDRMRVREAVALFARAHRTRAPAVAELVERWGLTSVWGRPFARLSGGERQRLFIALALLNRPEVVFFDELTTGLDPRARRDTWSLVEQVRREGAAVVLVTHFMDEAEQLCDRLAVLDAGRVVAAGTADDLVARVDPGVRVTFSGDGRDLSWLAGVDGVHHVSYRGGRVEVAGDGRAAVAVAAALVAHGLRPTDFGTSRTGLEEAFLALTGRGGRR